MDDVSINQINALCPTCGKLLSDRTYIDIDEGMIFFRTIFECTDDNWALMTRLDEYNIIANAKEKDIGHIMESLEAQIKLDLSIAVIRKFTLNDVRNYPLDTVEKFMKNGDTFYSKTMTGRASAFLHVFYNDLATKYALQSQPEKQRLALQAAVAYLIHMDGCELLNVREDKGDRENAMQIFRSLSDLYRENGNIGDADRVIFEAHVWLRKEIE